MEKYKTACESTIESPVGGAYTVLYYKINSVLSDIESNLPELHNKLNRLKSPENYKNQVSDFCPEECLKTQDLLQDYESVLERLKSINGSISAAYDKLNQIV